MSYQPPRRFPRIRKIPWPKSIAGQMIALILIALAAVQIANLAILGDERRQAVRAVAHDQILSRTASLVRLLNDAPPGLHEQLVAASSSPRLGFGLGEADVIESGSDKLDSTLSTQLTSLLGDQALEVRVDARDRTGFLGWRSRWQETRWMSDRHAAREDDADDDDDDGDEVSRDHRHKWGPPWRRYRRLVGLDISVLTREGVWLNVHTLVPPRPPGWALPSMHTIAVLAVVLVVIVIVMVQRITRPMRRLAKAADALGRGEDGDPLPEDGPQDVRQTTRAFNQMRGRLKRFLDDRTQMLAAISHDLRTPITSLRIRAELVEDEDLRQKMIDTLEEMQRMAEATLDFVREEADEEATRRIDLDALIASICDDFIDLGRDVSFSGPKETDASSVTYACRPLALKRAIRNLVDNALFYAGQARVSLEAGVTEFVVVIEDDGPGIPEDQLEHVFEPFVRVEESRNPETGGIGLGLAIARSIIHGHGGEISLGNRPEGGLSVRVSLPL